MIQKKFDHRDQRAKSYFISEIRLILKHLWINLTNKNTFENTYVKKMLNKILVKTYVPIKILSRFCTFFEFETKVFLYKVLTLRKKWSKYFLSQKFKFHFKLFNKKKLNVKIFRICDKSFKFRMVG